MESLGKLKQFVNDPLFYNLFNDYLNFKLSLVHRGLENAASMEEIFRLQGKADAYKKLLMLREEVNGPSN